jgi:hypothetical protein
MLDTNFVLVGTKYKWAAQDMPVNHDDRSSEIGFMEFGFDYGRFAFNLYGAGVVDSGVHVGSQFQENSGNLLRYGLTYQNQLFKIDVQYGGTSYNAFGLKFFRANGQYAFSKYLDLIYSFIYRGFSFSDPNFFQYASTSYTDVLYLKYKLSHKFQVGGFVSLESFANQYGPTSLISSSQNLYSKAGLFGALSF